MLRTAALVLSLAFTTLPAAAQNTERAIFAGGCFWCVESDFDKVGGVISTTSGYIGGTTENPTYENHTAARHREAVEIVYDPSRVSYDALLAAFFRSVDPTDAGGQFCDRGYSYTTAVYAVGDAQLAAAREAKAEASQALGGAAILAGGGIPPGLLHQESAALPLLSRRVRARRAGEGSLGVRSHGRHQRKLIVMRRYPA
jgi:peptide-methionine (S)-S-oxide reductase